MTLLSWIVGSSKPIDKDEKKKLRSELASSAMQFERRNREVRKLADDVMRFMHRKADNEKD